MCLGFFNGIEPFISPSPSFGGVTAATGIITSVKSDLPSVKKRQKRGAKSGGKADGGPDGGKIG